MGKTKLKLFILSLFVILLIPTKVLATETLAEYMTNQVGPSEQYNTMVTPAYTKNNASEENVNPQSGELVVSQTDYVLPGVNGLDLEIKRLYKSGTASLGKPSLIYLNGTLIDDYDSTANASNSYQSTFYEMRYNLGVGWRFSFPTIENRANSGHLFLHTESGDVYRLSGPDQNGLYTIENHPVQDVTLKTSTGSAFTSQGTNANGTYTMTSAFVMIDKNGKKTYFDSEGRILGIVDRTGNKITFQYTDFVYNLSEGALTKTLISKIIDTIGRQVSISYQEDPTLRETIDNTDYKFQVIITLPNGKTIVYDKECFSYNVGSTKHVLRTKLRSVYDVDAYLPINDQSPWKTVYLHDIGQLGFTFLNGTNYTTVLDGYTYPNINFYLNISAIYDFKTNRYKSFDYGDISNPMYRFVKPLSYGGLNGSMEYRKVIEVQDWDLGTNVLKNDVKYSYTNEPQGYYFHSNTWSIYPGYDGTNQTYLTNTYRYYTEITDGRGAKTKYTFDGTGRTVNVEKSGTDHHEIITTTYDSNKLPLKKQTVSFNVVNGVDGSSVTTTENYLYDQKGNLLQYTGPDAPRDANGNPTGNTYTTSENTTVNEHTVVYTYDNNFNQLTSKTWKQDSTILSRIECDVNPTSGNVTQVRNIHTGNNVISDFQYDAKGNITQKKVHYANNSGNTYTTNYVYGSEEDGVDRGGSSSKYNGLYYGGAYLTREYSTLDGTQISKKYVYDFNTGLKAADLDGNDNRTDYIYDWFDRLWFIAYPDYSYKEFNYVDYDDYYPDPSQGDDFDYSYHLVVAKDQNDNYFRYLYDVLGNLVKYQTLVWTSETQSEWKTLREMTYDANGNKTKEVDAYGHYTKFDYDSANRLKQKQFWTDDSHSSNPMTLQYTVGADNDTPLLVTVTDEDGYIKKYHYDISNRLVKLEVSQEKTNPTFSATSYTYDYVGNQKSEVDPSSHATNYTYDDLGRLKSRADARGHMTQYSYDAGGNVIQQINQRGKSSYIDYDLLGRVIRKKEPAADGSMAITRYVYDAAGNKTKEILPNNYDSSKDTPSLVSTMTGMSYTYNNMNRLEFILSPEGIRVEARGYDGNGNVTKVVDGLRYNDVGGIEGSPGTTYVYDAFNRKLFQTDATGQEQSFTYLLTGQMETFTDENHDTTTYHYYPDGTLQWVDFPDGGKITYTYDNRKNKTSETVKRDNTTNLVTSYSYNGFGKIATVTDPYQNQIVYGYDGNGNLHSVQDKRGNYTYYTYYDDNDLKSKQTYIDANNYAEEDYETDEAGNVTKKTLTGNVDPSSSRVTAFTYYDNNLLQTTADSSSQSNSGAFSKNYYDKDKNLTKVETRRDASNFDVSKSVYDNRDRKIQSIKLVDQSDVYNAASLPNIANLQDPDYPGKIKMITGYTYDIIGNLKSTTDPRGYGYLSSDTANRNLYTTSNEYDILNRLQTVTKTVNGTPVAIKYYYDAVGNKKAVRNERGFYTVYTYDSMNRLLTLTDSETDPSLKSYSEAQIIALVNQTTNSLAKTTIYTYDLAGNNTSVKDANGFKTDYAYDLLNRLQTVKAPYDPSQPDSASNPYNQVVDKRIYDANGNLVKEIDAKGYQSGGDDNSRYGTLYTYDFANRLLTELDPEGQAKGLTFTTQYQYNQYGEKTKKIDALNNSTSYYYNSAGILTSVVDACNITTSYTYDQAGNRLSTTNGKGKVTSYGLGAGSLLRSVTDANHNVTTYKYDLAGNTADMLDRNVNETVMTYDARNLLLSKSVAQTGDNISYTYDEVGNRKTMTDASGVSRQSRRESPYFI